MEQLAVLPANLTGHLQLTLVAMVLGVAISVPLGIIAARVGWLQQFVLGAAGIVQTIPSLALLAMMVPILAAINLQSIGYLPAIIGLTLYSTLPILRNTVIGITGIDSIYTEAARSVGMTPLQQLWRVELPLALPVIVGGVRTSTVWVVGMATLSTPVGATSLGNYIFSGLQLRNYTAVLVGCIAAALLAQLLDTLIRWLELGVRTRKRVPVVVALLIFGALYSWVGASLMPRLFESDTRPITIGCKTYTEQYILSEILSRQITARTGLETTVVSSLGSTVAFDALRAGDLDVYVDYSGTIWATIMGRDVTSKNRDEVLHEVDRVLADEYDVQVVGPVGFENTYVLAMRRDDAATKNIRRISDLVRHAPRLVMGGDYEFFGRPEWTSLRDQYALEFESRRTMDSSLMYQALAQSEVDVISAYSTDGRISTFDLIMLEDDLAVIPPYDAIILVNDRLRIENPKVVEALADLVGTIDAAQMRDMNLAVNREGRTPAAVAADWLNVPRPIPPR